MAIPNELQRLPNWCISPLPSKKPTQLTGALASSTDPATWTTFDKVSAWKEEHPFDETLFGFMVTQPYVCVDLDHCRNAKTGAVDKWAADIVDALGSYTEISSSGTGLHIFVKTRTVLDRQRVRNIDKTGKKVEMFPCKKPIAMTGDLYRKIDAIRTVDLTEFIAKNFGESTPASTNPSDNDFHVACMVARSMPNATEEQVKAEFLKHVKIRDKVLDRPDYVKTTVHNAIERVKADAASKPQDGKAVALKTYSDIESIPTTWLWQQRIPQGMLTIFTGNPDSGKTTVALDIIARYTTGRAYPDGAPNTTTGGEVLLLIAEDDKGRTIKPRLQAAGADLTRVHDMTMSVRKGMKVDELQLAFDTDLGIIEDVLRSHPAIGLIVADPITGYLGRADMNKEQELRRVLEPLKAMCERTGVTFIGVGHFNKRQDVNAIHKASGAVAMTGVPRAVWAFGKDPEIGKEDTESLDRMMVLVKGNLAKKRTGLKYGIISKTVPGLVDDVAFILWGEETNKTANDLMVAREVTDRKRDVCGDWILDYLKDGNQHPAREGYVAAESAGYSEKTVKRAMSSLKDNGKIIIDQTHVPYQHWYWQLKNTGNGNAATATVRTAQGEFY